MLLRTLTTILCLSTAAFSQVTGSALPRPARPEPPPVEYNPEELCTVSGTIRDEVTGEPVRKAMLQLYSMQPRSTGMPATAETNGEGAFIFTGVDPGEYRLSANRTGYVSREYGAAGRHGFGSGSTLKLEKAQKVSQLEIKLIPHSVLSGRIVDEDGDPVTYAEVQLMRFRYMQGSRQLVPSSGASTNDLGEYRIFGVAPGKYYLSVMYRSNYGMSGAGVRVDATGGEEGYSATYYPGVSNPASAIHVEVGQGVRMQGLDVKLIRTRTFRVSGQVPVTGNANRPPVTVALARRDATQYDPRGASAAPAPNGKFVLRGVQPGSYDVVATHMTPEARLSARVSVEVTNAHVDVGLLTFAAGPDVTGIVRGEGDTQPPLDGVVVYLRPTQDQQMFLGPTSAAVKADGTFLLKSAPRSKSAVQLLRLPEGYYLKSARSGDVDLLAAPFDLGAVASAAFEFVVSEKAAQVQGKVVDANGQPATAAAVVLVPASEEKRKRQELWGRTQTDQNGGFSFKSRAPGEYYLIASMDLEMGEEADPEFVKHHDGKAEKFELKESASETRQLKLSPPRQP